MLAERIRYLFDCSGRTYGSPRITLDLREEDWQVSQNSCQGGTGALSLTRNRTRWHHAGT
ncbi:IS3 family transposase [Streptomyces sp. NPDC050844]|uniref:IS3 family transposase n=1 Tax=Streptomyces sp. NPDC050844 TaxID=3155790 RepID=UPI0033E71BF4